VEGLQDGTVAVGRGDAILKVVRERVMRWLRQETGLEGGLNGTRALREEHNSVGRVMRAKRAGEVLGAEEGEVLGDWERAGFSVQVGNGGHEQAAGGNAKRAILEGLEVLLDCRGIGVGEPDWGGVGEDGADEGAEGQHQSLFLLAPICASKSFEDVAARGGALLYVLGVRREFE
jgi:hypothetical protein